LCILLGMGNHKLIRIYKENEVFHIDKDLNTWLFSEARFLVIPEKKEIAIPIIRMKDAGMVQYWTYNSKFKKMEFYQKKYIDETGNDKYMYGLDDPEYVKRIVRKGNK
jgi:hypothetical protein